MYNVHIAIFYKIILWYTCIVWISTDHINNKIEICYKLCLTNTYIPKITNSNWNTNFGQYRPKKLIRNFKRSNLTHAKKLETLSPTLVSYKKLSVLHNGIDTYIAKTKIEPVLASLSDVIAGFILTSCCAMYLGIYN